MQMNHSSSYVGGRVSFFKRFRCQNYAQLPSVYIFAFALELHPHMYLYAELAGARGARTAVSHGRKAEDVSVPVPEPAGPEPAVHFHLHRVQRAPRFQGRCLAGMCANEKCFDV